MPLSPVTTPYGAAQPPCGTEPAPAVERSPSRALRTGERGFGEVRAARCAPLAALRGAGVLVLGDHRQSLTVARSLHRAGYRVIAGGPSGNTILERSRCVAEVWDHPPNTQRGDWAGALQEFCAARKDLGVVFPVGDGEIELVEPLAGRLPVLVAIVAPPILAVCRSKRALLALADDTGVPTQPWELVESPDALAPALTRVGLPAVMKPDVSAHAAPGFKAAILRSEADALGLLAQGAFPRSGFVLQRLAGSVRHNVYFVARKGRLIGHMQVRILGTDRPDGTGLAVEGESVPPSPALLDWTGALAARLSYTGVGCAQFLVEEPAGSASFLEINARLGANCATACACGLDLPRLFIEALLGVTRPQPPATVGRHYAWLYGDLVGLASSLRSGRATWWQGIAWLGRAAMAQLSADHHITWSWRDPLPTIIMFGGFLRACFRALIRGRLFARPHPIVLGRSGRRVRARLLSREA